jgi:hypothetical protein
MNVPTSRRELVSAAAFSKGFDAFTLMASSVPYGAKCSVFPTSLQHQFETVLPNGRLFRTSFSR